MASPTSRRRPKTGERCGAAAWEAKVCRCEEAVLGCMTWRAGELPATPLPHRPLCPGARPPTPALPAALPPRRAARCCRALLFDREIRGQLAMLMGGRAAEEISCDAGACGLAAPTRRLLCRARRSAAAGWSPNLNSRSLRLPPSLPLSPPHPAVSTGAMDDIRRATDLAYKAVSGARSCGVCEAGPAARAAPQLRRASRLRCSLPPATHHPPLSGPTPTPTPPPHPTPQNTACRPAWARCLWGPSSPAATITRCSRIQGLPWHGAGACDAWGL